MPVTRLPEALIRGPFTVAEARRAGVSKRALQGPAVRRLRYGVYLAADVEVTEVVMVVAALRVLPAGTAPTGVTALRMYGVELGPATPMRFCGEQPREVERDGISLTRVRAMPPMRRRLVSPEHAFLTAAADLDLVTLVAAGDWLVRLGLSSPADLVAYCAASRIRGSRTARRAAGLVRRRVDSPQESRLRLCLVLAGLPEPDCNAAVVAGSFVLGHADLAYLAHRLLLEYEGDHHRTDRRQWNVDIGRFEEFAAEGYATIRVTAARMRRPRHLVERVHRALCDAGYRGPAPTFSPEWSRLFPSAE